MKRVVLVSLGLIFVAGYVGCLPADSGMVVTTGKGGSNGGSGPGSAGTTGQGGDTSGDAGTTGQGGDTSGDAGTTGMGGSVAGTTGMAGTGIAGTMGGGGTTGRGGTTGMGGSTAGTTGSAGRGGTTGAGGSAAGTTGTAGRGGTTGTAGTTGAAGRGGTTGAGGSSDPMAAAEPLNGQMLTGPCMQNTEVNVCATVAGACPDQNNSDIALRGVKTTDKTITMGGTSGVTYTAVLHVQGVVESKNYTGGTDQNSATSLSSPNMDGWRNGGTPGTNNAYNVYMLRVTNPGSTTHTDYFLNSLDPPGVENHTTYGINYMTPASGNLAFTFQGGASIRIVAADSNCSMIKNCGPSPTGCSAPIIISGVESSVTSKNASFNFTTAYNGQWVGIAVKSVTQN
jgi:hypothetical protein